MYQNFKVNLFKFRLLHTSVVVNLVYYLHKDKKFKGKKNGDELLKDKVLCLGSTWQIFLMIYVKINV